MARRERDVLEHAVQAVAEQAAKADNLIDEATSAGGPDHPVTIAAKQLRLELLNVKAELERELAKLVLRLHRLRHGGPLGSGRQHVRPGSLGASLPGAARRAGGLTTWPNS